MHSLHLRELYLCSGVDVESWVSSLYFLVHERFLFVGQAFNVVEVLKKVKVVLLLQDLPVLLHNTNSTTFIQELTNI